MPVKRSSEAPALQGDRVGRTIARYAVARRPADVPCEEFCNCGQYWSTAPEAEATRWILELPWESETESPVANHPRLRVLITLALILASGTQDSPSPGEPSVDARYLQQTPPGEAPERFAPGRASQRSVHEFGSVFSKDGLEYFYGVDVGGRSETRTMKFKDGQWSDPVTILEHPVYGFNDPFLSPDETGEGPKKDHDIWYVERKAGGWSKPINVGPAINSDKDEYYMSFSEDGSMYFGSNVAATKDGGDFDLYCSRFRDGEFQKAERLAGEINSPGYEADICVSPDESFAIFSSSRRGTRGRGDLYISFRDSDGQWSAARNMGRAINTRGHELCPFLTADGKYLFYTSRGDIYWVSTSILESMRE